MADAGQDQHDATEDGDEDKWQRVMERLEPGHQPDRNRHEQHHFMLTQRMGEDRWMQVSEHRTQDGGTVRDIYLTGPTNIVCIGEVTDEDLNI